MPLFMLPLFSLQQAPMATSRRTVACVLEMHGSINTRQKGPRGTETLSETFQVAIRGWLEEVESPSGSVSFTFTAAEDPRFPPTGMLNHRLEIQGKASREVVQFYGSTIKAPGPFRFTAGLRGQNLYPLGHLEIAGHASIIDGKGVHDETRTIRFVPFPEIRKGPGDFAAPTLRFGTSSLWRLHKTEAPFMVKGSVTYRNSTGGASYAGRVELTFMLDPRTRK
jgi:hypothetical protein